MTSTARRLTVTVRSTRTRSRLGGAIRRSIRSVLALSFLLLLLARDDLLALGALDEFHERLDRRLHFRRIRVRRHVAGLRDLPRAAVEVRQGRLDAVHADELHGGGVLEVLRGERDRADRALERADRLERVRRLEDLLDGGRI